MRKISMATANITEKLAKDKVKKIIELYANTTTFIRSVR